MQTNVQTKQTYKQNKRTNKTNKTNVQTKQTNKQNKRTNKTNVQTKYKLQRKQTIVNSIGN